jgi:hypothetical protein
MTEKGMITPQAGEYINALRWQHFLARSLPEHL